jgi:hypothetical protein
VILAGGRQRAEGRGQKAEGRREKDIIEILQCDPKVARESGTLKKFPG